MLYIILCDCNHTDIFNLNLHIFVHVHPIMSIIITHTEKKHIINVLYCSLRKNEKCYSIMAPLLSEVAIDTTNLSIAYSIERFT